MNTGARVLVAGMGNIFLGDDGFGSAVIARLREQPPPPGVRIEDYGIRGLDLAYTLMDGWELVILVDAVQRDRPPGTVYIIAPENDDEPGDGELDPHAMTPAAVLALLRQQGGVVPPLRLVGCEPAELGGDEGQLGLSATVEAAIPHAVAAVYDLLAEYAAQYAANRSVHMKEAV